MRAGISRRAFVAAMPLLSRVPARGTDVIPSQSKRLRDPATEFEMTRLTDPAANCWLVSPPDRSISGRSNSVLYCSDRSGSMQAYRLDLKSGESRELTTAQKMDRTSLAWL